MIDEGSRKLLGKEEIEKVLVLPFDYEFLRDTTLGLGTYL